MFTYVILALYFVLTVSIFLNSTLTKEISFQVIAAADELIDSIDKEELAKYLSLKPDPDDEEAQVDLFFLSEMA
jgi:hypothetical protein